MNKTAAQQEKEIADVIKRADKSPDKTGSQRRDALRRLIDLTHSPHSNLKIFAAVNIKNYFNDFPDLEDSAINAIYDLCEDQDSTVRTAGYSAILQVSRDQRRWVKRNADVLVQLLQSDEPDEVELVKKALAEHLDLDPQVTLGVLCDQIVPMDEAVDEEEQNIRDRLRALVISFLTGRAKRAIVERHASKPGSEAEQVLVGGLVLAISTSNNTAQTGTIVKDLLLALPSYKPFSDRSQELLASILAKAKSTLKNELRPSDNLSLNDTRFYLNLAAEIVVVRRLALAVDLLQFYCSSLLGKMVLQRLTQETQLFVVFNVAKLLANCNSSQATSPSEQLSSLRRQIVDATPILLQVLLDAKPLNVKSWEACGILLNACAERKRESSWTVPQNLTYQLNVLEAQTRVGEGAPQGIQDLLRSFLQAAAKPASSPHASDVSRNKSSSDGTSSSKGDSLHDGNDRTSLPTRRINIPSKSRNTSTIRDQATGPMSIDHPTLSFAMTSTQKRTTTPGESPQPSKRAKGEGENDGTARSLLSRMGTKPSPPSGHRMVAIQSTAPSARLLSQPDDGSSVGFSIKGAAQAERSRSTPLPPSSSKPASLLDRMKSSEGAADRRKWDR